MCIILGGDCAISHDGHMLPYRAMEAQAELSRCSFCAQPPSDTISKLSRPFVAILGIPIAENGLLGLPLD